MGHEMTVLIRLYLHHRRAGMPRRTALKRALASVLRDFELWRSPL